MTDKVFHLETVTGSQTFTRCKFSDVIFDGVFKLHDCIIECGCSLAKDAEVTGSYKWLGHECRDPEQVHPIDITGARGIGTDTFAKYITTSVWVADKLVNMHACDITDDMIEADRLFDEAVELNEDEEGEADRIMAIIGEKASDTLPKS